MPDRADDPLATLHRPDGEGRPGIWAGIGIVALYFALQIAFALVFNAIVGFVLALRAHAVPAHGKFDANAAARALQANPDFRVVLTFVVLAAAAATTAWLVHRFWPLQWSRAELPGFGLVRARGARIYAAAIALGLIVMFAGGSLTQFLAHGHPVQQDISVLAHSVSPAMRVLLVVLAVCIAPFIEELVFRGVLLSGLARRMPIGWAMLLSAVVFGAAHLPDFKFAWFPVPELVLLGLALAWIRVRARSLWPSIATHATFNLIATLGGFFLTHPPQ